MVACTSPDGSPDTSKAPATKKPKTPTSRKASLPKKPSFPFSDITAATGIDFVHDNGADGQRHYVETMGPGVALFDADGDGDLDLYVVNGGPLPGAAERPPSRNHLYRNLGVDADGMITFEDITAASGAGDTGYGMGVAVGDWDGDGDLDLYLLNFGPNALYSNRGDGTFERLEIGVEDPTWSVSAAFFDAEGDGDLDLYVANYLRYDIDTEKPCKAGNLEIYCSPEQYPPTPDRLYRNEGDHFVDASQEMGVFPTGRGMGVATGDLDDDGDFDIYVTNDRSQNLLYRNEDGRFQEVAAEAGVGYSQTGQAEGGMGVAIGDFLGNGKAAVFLTNFQKEPNRLFATAFAGFFDDHTNTSGLGFPSTEMVGWGIGSLDFEGDGDIDLVVANGHVFDNAAAFIPGSSFELADQLFTNGGSGRFERKNFPGKALSSRGVATGDLDGDGDPDLVVASCGGPLQVWRNEMGTPQRFLVLRLEGTAPNTHALGARVVAHVAGRNLTREVASGGSYASHSDTRVYLGLGEEGKATTVEVRWPDGSSEQVTDLPGGQEIVWRQGAGIVDRKPLGGGS
jgi:hypothetical protein